jgi:hypothetical protein
MGVRLLGRKSGQLTTRTSRHHYTSWITKKREGEGIYPFLLLITR